MGYFHFLGEYFDADGYHGRRPGFFQRENMKNASHFFFQGAGFVASFAAIGNIVEIERGFHNHLSDFKPFMKFWGTKVIVSIAFLQSTALALTPPFIDWSDTRKNLFYASLLCF